MKNRIKKENRNKDDDSKWNKCKQLSKNKVNWLSVYCIHFYMFFILIFGILMEVKCHSKNHFDCRNSVVPKENRMEFCAEENLQEGK